MALLSDQLENQTEKISDLQRVLGDKRDILRRTEESLQREVLSRSSLETRKLELLSEISGLKLRQATLEKENLDLKRQLQFQPQSGSGAGGRGERKSYGGHEITRGVKIALTFFVENCSPMNIISSM